MPVECPTPVLSVLPGGRPFWPIGGHVLEGEGDQMGRRAVGLLRGRQLHRQPEGRARAAPASRRVADPPPLPTALRLRSDAEPGEERAGTRPHAPPKDQNLRMPILDATRTRQGQRDRAARVRYPLRLGSTRARGVRRRWARTDPVAPCRTHPPAADRRLARG